MADHSKPTVLSTESGFVTEMHDRINDTARLFDATDVSGATNQPTGTQRINRSIASLQRWDGAAWVTFGGYIPSGTTMLFVQAAAPAGWTKLITHNDKALRVVSGTGGGSGGSVGFTTAFASKSVAGGISSTTATGGIASTTATGSISGLISATTLSASQIPPHAHGQYVTNPVAAGGAWSRCDYTTEGQSGIYDQGIQGSIVGGGQGHSHSHTLAFNGTSHGHTFTGTAHGHTFTGTAIDLAVQYVDIIICSKD